MSVGWISLVRGSWISFIEGICVGTDVGAGVGAAVGFLDGLAWLGRLVGLDVVGLADVGRCVGRGVNGRAVTGLLVGLEAISSAALNFRSSIAKYSLVTGASASVIRLV